MKSPRVSYQEQIIRLAHRMYGQKVLITDLVLGIFSPSCLSEALMITMHAMRLLQLQVAWE